MAYNFSNTLYERSHEKAPRGRGWWMFIIGGSRKLVDIPGCMNLSEAKKLMTAKAKEMGVPAGSTIYVAP